MVMRSNLPDFFPQCSHLKSLQKSGFPPVMVVVVVGGLVTLCVQGLN